MRSRSVGIALVPPAAVVALWLGVVLTPSSHRAADLQERLDASNAEFVELTATLDDSRTLNEQLAVLNAEVDELSKAVPPTTDISGFVRLVHSIGLESGTLVSAVTPQTSQPTDASTEAAVTNITLSIEGSYGSIMAFTNALLVADRLVEITAIDLTADASTDRLFVEVGVSIYSATSSTSPIDLSATTDRQISDPQVSDAAAGLTLEADT